MKADKLINPHKRQQMQSQPDVCFVKRSLFKDADKIHSLYSSHLVYPADEVPLFMMLKT